LSSSLRRRCAGIGAASVWTIGIGGSPACDGQILVIDDMLGLFTEFTPKFVKRYRRLGDEIRAAAREYAEEVRQGRFPAACGRAHLFAVEGGYSDHVSEADPANGAASMRSSFLTPRWRRQSGANPSLKWDFRNNGRSRVVYSTVTAA
jgi:hypothetical protein